jgi:hypothetical protein
MDFYDDVNATLLALIAKAPQDNRHFLDRLTGNAKEIGEAIVILDSNPKNLGVVPDLAIRKEAETMLAWAKSNRARSRSKKGITLKQPHELNCLR